MDKLLTYDIRTIANKIKKGEISPVKLVEHVLKRIRELDPLLNSFISVDEEGALQVAAERENEIRRGIYRGPLHGIPIGLKDNIDTADLITTAGSEILANNIPQTDAPLVESLKEAGAIIIGKQNLHQFAYGPTGDRSSHGPVRNPHNLAKMTGGSSSGSAASVAAYLCFGSIGTDTGGSIRIPASFCGIVGMKPTYGRVSKRGVYPLSWTLDHAGPMTRTISDNAILLNALVMYDAEDPDAVSNEAEDFTRLIGKELTGSKIGIPDRFYFDQLDEEVAQAIQETTFHFEQLGAEIVTVTLPDMESFSEAQRIILRCDAYALHEKNLADFPDEWDEEVKERLLTAIGTSGADYANARQVKKKAEKQFAAILDEVDALLTPTIAILPPDIDERFADGQNGTQHIRSTITRLTGPTNLTGFPSLSIPCGYSTEGLPIGVQLIGQKFDEGTLYQLGYALEQKLILPPAKFNIPSTSSL